MFLSTGALFYHRRSGAWSLTAIHPLTLPKLRYIGRLLGSKAAWDGDRLVIADADCVTVRGWLEGRVSEKGPTS